MFNFNSGTDSPSEDRRILDAPTVSYENSPRAGPSRSTSLRAKHPNQRVTFEKLDEPNASWSDEISYMDVDGHRVELRKRGRSNTDESDCDTVPTSSPAGAQPPTTLHPNIGGQTQTKSQEPNIDFELDVKVLINSGKCVLHTKESNTATEDMSSTAANKPNAPARPLRKDRSCSAGLLDFGTAQAGSSIGSPDTGRRRDKTNPQQTSQTRFQAPRAQAHQPLANQLIDLTIFRIPGMDVKVHYESKVKIIINLFIMLYVRLSQLVCHENFMIINIFDTLLNY